MALSPSAHADTFCRDNLPPAAQWPDLTGLDDLAYPGRLNAAQEFLAPVIAAGGADRRCLLSPEETWSYGETWRRARQVAEVLTADFGIVPGNRVLLRAPNNPWLVTCWLGVVAAGAVAVTTMPMLRASELSTICEIGAVQLALCDHRLTGELAAAAVPGLPVVQVGGDGPEDLVQRAATMPGTFEPVPTAADDVAMIAFTSGTTGRPKATLHFHRDLLAIADTFSAQLLQPGPDDLFTATPPIAFTFGLGALIAFPLRAGAAALLVEKASPAQLAGIVERHQVTMLFSAPTAYKAMLTADVAGKLGSVRRAVSAGEHLPETTWEDFHKATGLQLIDGIGSTELLHIFIASAGDHIRPGSTGKPVPGYEAMVVDARGAPVPDGQPGRLAVKGPTGCRYLADPRQADYVSGGWNLTGDTYVRDADGYYWYQARSDDMIISAGYNIAGPEIEDVLLAHPQVAECGVVGAPDLDRGQIVKAYVVLAPGVAGDDAKARELQDLVKQKIAPYKYPRAVEFVEALPRTDTGKLQRFRLRALAAGE